MNKGSAAWQAILVTPIGPLGVATDGVGVTGVDFLPPAVSPKPADTPLAGLVVKELERYFLDASNGFVLPLHAAGTEFQQSVWRLLQTIPLGQVWTYGDMARKLGSSPRAVGNACRRNPLPVIVPCHRVVSAQGLGGYAGETAGRNMEIKSWLLAHEGVGLPL
jgi:methylated-DNA-[protein]-cysteine S-methyltransferase